MIVIYLSLVLVCTLLTTFEFVLGTITILSIRTTVFGLWLLRLHRTKGVPMRVFEKPYYTIHIEIISLLVGTWIALSVALTEYKLSESFLVQSSNLLPSKYCQVMNASFYEDVLSEARPPSQYVIDEITVEMVKQVSCPYGIASMDFGTLTSTETAGDFALAPNCVDNIDAINASDVPAVMSDDINLNGQAELSMRLTNFHIIPYRLPNNGFSSEQSPIPLPECYEKRIESNTVTIARPRWRVREVDDLNISRSIVESICERQNESFSSITVDQFNGTDCFGGRRAPIKAHCLYNRLKNGTLEGNIHNITLSNVSALMSLQNGSQDPNTFFRSLSYACVDASVRMEYTFLSNKIIPKFYGEDAERPVNRSRSFILPLRVELLSGQCERSMNALALSALIYSSKAEWESQDPDLVREVLKLGRQQRFHAYMISLARFNFAVEGLSNPQNLKQGCEFRKAIKATRIDTDAVFVMFITTLSVYILCILSAVVFKIIIPAHAWKMVDYANRITSEDIQKPDTSTQSSSLSQIDKRSLRTFQSDQAYRDAASKKKPSRGSIFISVEDEKQSSSESNNDQGQGRWLSSDLVYRIKTVKTDDEFI